MMNPNRDPQRELQLAKRMTHENFDIPAIRLVDEAFAETILRPARRPVELALAVMDASLLMLGLMAVMSITHVFGGNLPQLLSMLGGNVVVATAFSFLFRYFDVSDGRYSLGKGLLMGFSLLVANIIGVLLMTGSLSLMTASVLTFGFVLFAFTSGWTHYELSRPFFTSKPDSFYCGLERGIKRAFDFAWASCGMIAVSPILLTVPVLLCLESKGSPIFHQVRVGRGERKFRMFKFRSMYQNADFVGHEKKATLYKREDDPRITPVGRLIRKLSIDELPQLWNVVRGEMSLVGPRPPLPSEYDQMNRYHRRKFEATPGLTGLWQIIGRVKNQRDFNSVAAYDVFYIENWCLLEDLKILLKTVPVVLLQKGAC